jgi:Ca2+-binding RTX toxin-like protein
LRRRALWGGDGDRVVGGTGDHVVSVGLENDTVVGSTGNKTWVIVDCTDRAQVVGCVNVLKYQSVNEFSVDAINASASVNNTYWL